MKILSPSLLLALLALSPAALRADSDSVWPTLQAQAERMAQAVEARDAHSLEDLTHVVDDEVAGLRRDPTLPPAAAGFLDEIAKWAAASFHAAKDNDWKSADTDQQNFARAVKMAQAAATAKPGKEKKE